MLAEFTIPQVQLLQFLNVNLHINFGAMEEKRKI